jgi:endonuclease III
MEGSDIAYDVHLRRVFLRTHLADRDDQAHIVAVARALHPTRPGELDLPTWLVGRGWCHAGIPECEACPLTDVCPKDIEGAAHVTSG